MPTRHLNGRSHDLTHPKLYTTESLDLAAWLVSQGFPLHRLDPPSDPTTKPLTRFVFPNTDDLADAVSLWESGQPVIGTDLRRYVSVKKDLYRRARQLMNRAEGVR